MHNSNSYAIHSSVGNKSNATVMICGGEQTFLLSFRFASAFFSVYSNMFMSLMNKNGDLSICIRRGHAPIY